MAPAQLWVDVILQAEKPGGETRTLRYQSQPALDALGRPVAGPDPLREYRGPLLGTMTGFRDAVNLLRSAGGVNSRTPLPDVLRAASILGEAFLRIGPEHAQKLEPFPALPPQTMPARRGFFKRPAIPLQPEVPITRIWWAYGGANRDGTITWPGWTLGGGHVCGPGEPYRIYSALTSPDLSAIQVGLTLFADDPSGDVAHECASDPATAWEHIRYTNWTEGDVLDRGARAIRFVVDSVAPG